MILGISGSIFVRILLNIIQSYLLKRHKIPKRKLLLISNKSEKSMQSILQDIGASRIYEIVAYANSKEKSSISFPHVSNVQEIESLVSGRQCDEILYIDSDFSKDELYKVWELSKIYGVRYRYVSNNFDITKTNTSLSLINRTPVIEIQNTPLENWGRI
jgi:hypothetical protein